MGKKYELLKDQTVFFDGVTLYRIRALRDIPWRCVNAGDLGGYVESERNLSQGGNAWVYGDAKVSGDARVFGDAQVHDKAVISNNAQVYDDAQVYERASVCGHTQVYGGAQVCGDTWVSGDISICGNGAIGLT
ncbi:hypothetical protein JHX32_19210 [Escherichia coli]|uniref:hypothetical protein n=1 Tax=Escherichia coli TaxID=562 RepID=UPI001BD34322|nr:hypothetical protein [Escherichia coli]MBS9709497.1 hypothetical protein [Escherichia coli]